MNEWEEYQSILREIQSEGGYQSYAKKQNTKFKNWLAKGPKRYASPYTSAAPTTSLSGLGPLKEDEKVVPDIKDDLNREIWYKNNELKSEISEKLLRIANDFYEKLGLPAPILDITFTGSMANYNWTDKSDIDLHIVIDYTSVDENQELVRGYLMEAKTNWNRTHEIRIKGHEVEIYVQDSNEPHHSTGVYSISNDEWEVTPVREEFEVSEDAIRQKTEGIKNYINMIEKLQTAEKYEEVYGDTDRLRSKLADYRSAGLEAGGEFSVENLVFKALRNSGELEKLSDLKRQAYDSMMSVVEAKTR
tara:strand:- start:1348 stop:2259 length:912 start_codon:yes stop_codon:yes gene_type:complete